MGEAGVVRQAVLDTAVQLFSERGYAATSVAAICDAAGVTKPTIYWHFQDKEGLLRAALAAATERLLKRISAAPQDADANRLDSLIAEWRAMVVEGRGSMRLPMRLQLERDDVATKAAVANIWQEAGDRIAIGIRAAVGMDLPDLDLVGHMTVTLLQGAAQRYQLEPDAEQLDRNLAELRRLITLSIWDRFSADLKKTVPLSERPGSGES